MAADEYGAVIEVSTTNLGAVFTADAIIGATALTLDDVSVFEELGGRVYIDGYTYYYVSVDHAANTMELLVGLTVAATADETRVEIFPPAPVRTALVAFGVEEGEAVRVTIPHFFSGMPDGVRTAEAREIALVEERHPGEPYLKDVMAKGMILLEVAEDLDDYTSQGTFMQLYSADAAGGANYPVPYAGLLEVLSTQPADIMVQRYTAYRTATDTNHPSAWVRTFGTGSWSSWESLQSAVDPVVADVAMTGSAHTVTTTSTLLAGVTATFTPPTAAAVYLVIGVTDVVATGAATGTVFTELYVDSTAQPAQILYALAATAGRGTPSQTWIVSGLSVASHTLQLRADGTGGITGFAIQPLHTTMKIILLSR